MGDGRFHIGMHRGSHYSKKKKKILKSGKALYLSFLFGCKFKFLVGPKKKEKSEILKGFVFETKVI